MRVLSGAMRPTAGAISLDGRVMRFVQPADAIRAGISMVHQELNLVRTLDIAENVMLGREPTRTIGLRVDRAKQRTRARELLGVLGSELNPDTPASDLSIAQAQFVEIAKCLASDARVLIFDEPTAVLGERESKRLFSVLRRLRDDGRAIIFISHHLDEVVAIADEITVLRDGKVVDSFARATDGTIRSIDGVIADEGMVANAMVGRPLASIYPEKGVAIGDQVVIELVDFGAQGCSHGINLQVLPGEIVGLAGLIGSGRTESAEAIVGLRPRTGSVRIGGRDERLSSVREAMAAGVVYVSEDRKGRGLHVTLSSMINLTLPSLDSCTEFGGLRVDTGSEVAIGDRWIKAFSIRCARPHAPISFLSGGNQQKISLARWLETKPRVLIIDEPTRGVDVGARAEIYRIIAELAREGLACIVISSELSEVIGLAHRALVMRGGVIAGELSRERLARADAQECIVRIASGVLEEGLVQR